MKKIISLLLVLCLIFALTPAAFADMMHYDEYAAKNPKEQLDIMNEVTSSKHWVFYGDYAFWYQDEADGILRENGHLVSCNDPNGANCVCFATLYAAEKEAAAQRAIDSLRVWVNSKRDSDDVLHDRVIAEIDLPYNDKYKNINQDYLDENEAINELLEDFSDSEKLNEELYLPSDFITNQIKNCLMLAEDNRNSGVSHLEYRLMAPGPRNISGVGIDFVKDGAREGGKEYIFSREALETEYEHDVAVNVGGFVVCLPEEVGNDAFTLCVSFNYDGSVRVVLADASGKLIPGAGIVAALPDGADADTKVTADGKVIDDAVVESGCAAFEAPTGDDVFALSK